MEISKQIKELNKQLYPTGRAWGYVHGSEQVDTVTTEWVDGFNNFFVDGNGNHFISSYGSEASPSKRLVNAYLKAYERLFTDSFSLLNQILADNEDFDEIDASNWERVYGLKNIDLTLDERKENILRKQSYPNGVAERGNYLFIQQQLQAAGFDVIVTENRFADGLGDWEVVDPVGLYTYTILANRIEESIDGDYFASVDDPAEMGIAEMGIAEMGIAQTLYSDSLRFTFFISGAFPTAANIPIARKDEFRELLLKLKPAQTIGFIIANYI